MSFLHSTVSSDCAAYLLREFVVEQRPRYVAVGFLVGCLLGGSVTAHDGSPSGLAEIVVTATRRTTDVQNIPVAITALSYNAVRDLQMTTIDSVAQQVPNLVVSAVGNNTPWVFMRGVGMNDINANSVGAVGIYQDDIYLNSTAAQLQQMHDIERVEVLKGPQGTLYGRNTTGGVIKLVAVKPAMRDELTGRVSYGRYDQIDLEGAANLAIDERWATRLAAVRHRRDAIFENTNGTGDGSDVDNWAARATLRYQPDQQDWLLTIYGSQVDARATEYDKSLLSEHPVRADVGVPRSEALTWPGHEKLDIRGATLSGSIDFARLNLTAITGIVDSKRDSRLDLDSSAPDWLDQRRWNQAAQITQEFRLTSRDAGAFEWTIGAYYFREDLDAIVLLRANQALNVPALTFLSDTQYSQHDASWAMFGDSTWQAGRRLSLFIGGRFTGERKQFTTSQQGYFNSPLATTHQVQTWREPSGSAGLSYAFTPQTMAYARYSHGFRAGGFNAGGGVNDPSFGPEYVGTGEIGFKSLLAEHRIRLNLALFSSDYRDMQVYALVADPAGATTQYLTNAAKAEIQGAEMELSWRFSRRFQIDLSGAYLDAGFQRYVDGSGIDRSGNALTGAPRATFSGLLRYELPLSGGARVIVTGDAGYRSMFYFDSANTERFAAGARTLWGARIAYVSSSERYGLSVWGRNLSDELYFVRATSFLNLDSIAVGEPRTYGIEISARL